jgi:XTP/dITP diphosphohydrolase
MADRLRVVLATGNKGKLADFKALLKGSGIELVLPEALGLEVDVEETGTTFLDNALLKSRALCEASGLPTLADDSGLAVDALDGAPGVYSARYAGPECDDDANNACLLANMEGVDDRSAAFVCVLALSWPDGRELTADGRCRGTITDSPRGSNGFGYDVVFFRDDLGCTFAEASPQQKNERSHRAVAVAELLALLEAAQPDAPAL